MLITSIFGGIIFAVVNVKFMYLKIEIDLDWEENSLSTFKLTWRWLGSYQLFGTKDIWNNSVVELKTKLYLFISYNRTKTITVCIWFLVWMIKFWISRSRYIYIWKVSLNQTSEFKTLSTFHPKVSLYISYSQLMREEEQRKNWTWLKIVKFPSTTWVQRNGYHLHLR